MKTIEELKNTIHFDGCLEFMDSNIPDKSIDLILCDLPYGQTILEWDKIIPMDLLWNQYERIIKDTGTILLFASQPFTSALVMSNPNIFRYEYVWVKTKATGFQNARKMPMKKHESILVFYKKRGTYNNINLVKLEKPIKNGRRNKGANHMCCANGDFNYELTETGFQDSILNFANPSGKGHLHPTQKPVDLLEELIKRHSNEGDVVLDNCMGVGSTCIACINTNRYYIGIENMEKHFNNTKDRIDATLTRVTSRD